MNIITRSLEPLLVSLAQDYPVVTILGPRQSGKTTLTRKAFPNKSYVSLEDIDQRRFVEQDTRRFLRQYPDGAIFDEVQNVPDLLSYIQGIVDSTDKKGMFILTGSYQIRIQERVSQSLAGRTAILKLLPFSLEEIDKKDSFIWTKYAYQGMFPRVYKDNLDPTQFYRGYVSTYVERDVRTILGVKDLSLFQTFLKLCAGRVGQLYSSSSLANDVGVSPNTIANWFSILEASFVVFRLSPYFENFGKRLIKAPKIYFYDVGLVSFLLGITSYEQIERDPLRGNLFENFCMVEIYKSFMNKGFEPPCYFYRDSNDNEVDLLIKKGHMLTPVEMKSGETFSRSFFKGLNYFQKVAGDCATDGYVVYAGNIEQEIGEHTVVNVKNSSKIVDAFFQKGA